jgi:hypothetical protein
LYTVGLCENSVRGLRQCRSNSADACTADAPPTSKTRDAARSAGSWIATLTRAAAIDDRVSGPGSIPVPRGACSAGASSAANDHGVKAFLGESMSCARRPAGKAVRSGRRRQRFAAS